jgi:hypothetical protein
MASANWIVAWTIRIAAMFGSTCSVVICHSPLPSARAAVTNSRERTTSALARVMRANTGTLKMPIATIEVTRPGP